MKYSLTTLLLFTLIIFSCRHESDVLVGNKDAGYINKAKQWTELSSQKLRESSNKESEIWLKDWDKAEVIVERNGERTVAVPARNRYLFSVNDKVEYNTYLLVKFENKESIIGSEILHVINEKYSIKESVRELVQGRNDLIFQVIF